MLPVACAGEGERQEARFLHVCFNPVLKFSSLRSLIRATRIAIGHSCFWLTLARRVFFDFPICCHVVFRTHYDGSARILWEGFVTWSWTILTLEPKYPKQISQPKVALAHRKVQGHSSRYQHPKPARHIAAYSQLNPVQLIHNGTSWLIVLKDRFCFCPLEISFRTAEAAEVLGSSRHEGWVWQSKWLVISLI